MAGLFYVVQVFEEKVLLSEKTRLPAGFILLEGEGDVPPCSCHRSGYNLQQGYHF